MKETPPNTVLPIGVYLGVVVRPNSSLKNILEVNECVFVETPNKILQAFKKKIPYS